MKRLYSIFLLVTIILSFLVSCSGFEGGVTSFYKDNNFYKNIGTVVGKIIGGGQSYIPLLGNDSSVLLETSLKTSKYEYGNTTQNKTGTIDTSLLITPNHDFELKSELDMFGQKASVHCITEKDNFYLDFGDDSQKPFYFKGTGADDITQKIVSEVINAFKDGNYVNGEEVYKVHGQNISANTVEICLNSDKTTEIIENICDFFIETKNLIYSSKVMQVLDYSYFIKGEKIHLTWKRYFNDSELCRESFKLHDNNGHYVVLDTMYLYNDGKEYVDISVNAFDGDGVFNIFALSAESIKSNDSFETQANAIIGDYLQIEFRNNGNDVKSEGKANVYFMTDIGKANLPITYSYSASGTADDGLDNTHNYKVSAESIYITFDTEFSFKATVTDTNTKISLEGDFYDVSVIENQLYYNESKTIHNKEYSDIITMLRGEIPDIDPEPSKPEIPAYELDIYYDYSIKFDTEGSYGQKYVELLQSDQFTYSYTYHSREEGYPINKCTQYRKGDENIYIYNYADGTEYKQLFAGTTRYEVRHDLEKILFTEYSEEDFATYYPEQVYIFYESGLCNYKNRELVFERYYDYSNNKYTFIFDENKEVEIIVVESSSDKSLLYTFIEELSDAVPENAMKLPSYDYVSVHDLFK